VLLLERLEKDIKGDCHNAHTSANLFTFDQESGMEKILNTSLTYITKSNTRLLYTETNTCES
jgi:hypothetical protein